MSLLANQHQHAKIKAKYKVYGMVFVSTTMGVCLEDEKDVIGSG